MANDRNLMNACFKIQPFYSFEDVLTNIKSQINSPDTRASNEFKRALSSASSSSLNPQVEYAPVYRVFTKGAFTWTDGGFNSAPTTRTRSQDLDIYIDDTLNQGVLLALPSFQDDKRKIYQEIKNDEVFKLKTLFPLYNTSQMAREINERLKTIHKGSYNLSDISILLMLVPVAKFSFIFNGEEYVFYGNLYDGEVDAFDIDVPHEVVNSYEKLDKIHKYSRLGKIGELCALALSFILTVFFANDKGSSIFGWIMFSAVPVALLIFPRHKMDEKWTDISRYYKYSDAYIKNDGKFTMKALLYIGFNALQLLVALIAVFFTFGIAFQ